MRYWTPAAFLYCLCLPPLPINNGQHQHIRLTLMLLVASLANTKWYKNMKNVWNPGKWVLIWEYSMRAIQWIPRWEGLDGFQKSLRPCALDEFSLNIGRVKTLQHMVSALFTSNLFTLAFLHEGNLQSRISDPFLPPEPMPRPDI